MYPLVDIACGHLNITSANWKVDNWFISENHQSRWHSATDCFRSFNEFRSRISPLKIRISRKYELLKIMTERRISLRQNTNLTNFAPENANLKCPALENANPQNNVPEQNEHVRYFPKKICCNIVQRDGMNLNWLTGRWSDNDLCEVSSKLTGKFWKKLRRLCCVGD